MFLTKSLENSAKTIIEKRNGANENEERDQATKNTKPSLH